MATFSVFQAFTLLKGALVYGANKAKFAGVQVGLFGGVTSSDLDDNTLPGFNTDSFEDETHTIGERGSISRANAQDLDNTAGVQTIELDYHLSGMKTVSKLKK